MKKIILALFIVLLSTGCDNISNTPTKQVEGLFNKYQTLDKEVLDDLDRVIAEEETFSDESRGAYREIIKKQYKNLIYKIKEETIDADVATVTVEITVTDFTKILAESSEYRNSHPEEFINANGEYSEKLYSDYVISKMKEANDRVKYTFDIKLSKIDEKWRVDGIDSDTEDKILGIYEY